MDEKFFEKESGLGAVSAYVLDAVLATSFDWKELANRLTASGRFIPKANFGMVEISHAVYRMAHTSCLVDNGFAEGIEARLNILHAQKIAVIEQMSPSQICHYLKSVDISDRKNVGGFLWALLVDKRSCIRRIADVFVRRIVCQFYSSAYYSEQNEFEKIMQSGMA